jgi:hypothetical protein
MTQRVDTLQFLRAWRTGAMIGCAIAAAAASGCTSTGMDELVRSRSTSAGARPGDAAQPASAQRGTASASAMQAAAAEPSGPIDTGTFPNLNIPPQTANAQISDEDKAAETEALRAKQQRTASTAANVGKGVADPVLLRKLAAEHADVALKKIEAQQ